MNEEIMKELADLGNMVEGIAAMNVVRAALKNESEVEEELKKLRDVCTSNKVAKLYLSDQISEETKNDIMGEMGE